MEAHGYFYQISIWKVYILMQLNIYETLCNEYRVKSSLIKEMDWIYLFSLLFQYNLFLVK